MLKASGLGKGGGGGEGGRRMDRINARRLGEAGEGELSGGRGWKAIVTSATPIRNTWQMKSYKRMKGSFTRNIKR